MPRVRSLPTHQTDGQPCGSPAIKTALFCYHHTSARKAQRPPPQLQRLTCFIPFVFPEDHAAMLHNQFLVIQALNPGRIDTRTAAS